MGLDMYLSKKVYVKNNPRVEEEKFAVTVTKNGEPTAIQPERVKYVVEEVMYWRKANAIHKWFVDNVQGGRDECQTSDLSREDLQELLTVCYEVKADPSKAMELLPPQAGFFFGSTEVDEWYMRDIAETITALEEELATPERVGRYFDTYEYRASW